MSRLLLLAAAAASASSLAAEEPVLRVGSTVRIIAPSVTRGWIDARLVRLEHDTLKIETRTFRQRHLSLPLRAVSRLEVRTEVAPRGASPAAIGAVAAAAGGFMIANAALAGEDCYVKLACLALPLLGAAAGAAVGGTAGAMVGDAVTSGEPWVHVPIERLAGATIITPPEPVARPARRTGERDVPFVVRVLLDIAHP